MTEPEETMPVSEVARRSGVTTATVNFYVREGLLPRPRKTARTRALYAASSVALIARIRDLQAHGLPLRVIRRVLGSEDPGAALGLPPKPQQRPARPATPEQVFGTGAYLTETGLEEPVFAELVDSGLLHDGEDGTTGQPTFSRQDIAAGRAYAGLLASGVPFRLIGRHVEYEPLARAEAYFLAEHLSAARGSATPGPGSATVVAAAFGVVRDYLRLRQVDEAYADWAAQPRRRTDDARASRKPLREEPGQQR